MGAFREYARAAMAAGGKRGRTPVMNAQRFYPRGLERELEQKTAAEFMRIHRAFLEAAVAGFSTFGDDQLDLSGESPALSEKFKGEVMDVARRTDRKARDNFSRQSEMIIGAPYYPPGTAEGILDDWHATFQDLCVSACAQQKTKMAVIVAGAKQAGWNKAQLEKAIERELPAQFRHRAELIARTELGKLNSRVTLETYKSTGVRYYKWLTTIDGRERESHAAMNGKICSVSDGDVYFDQNPERPLHPVERQRTGDMYHGHPGTDFQCRCSMVMWDPEIDGDYEVKDSDLIEERRAAEKAEKEARERAEAERQEKLRAEQEKAAEELKTAKEAARKAEAERAAAEKAKREAEETAKRLENEKIRAERIREILKKASDRHSRRTPTMVEKLRTVWRKRQARNAHIIPQKNVSSINDVQMVMDRYLANYPGESVLPKIHVQKFSEPPKPGQGYVLMEANSFTGTIGFNSFRRRTVFGNKILPSPFDLLKSALNKIRKGQLLEQKEEYAIESFYHEINHTKAKKNKPLKPHGMGDYKRTAMETINQFVSRHQYADFIKRMGGTPSNQDWVLNEGDGYYQWVKNLRRFILDMKIPEKDALSYFEKHLFNDPYDTMDDVLYEFLKKHSRTRLKRDEALKMLESVDDDAFVKNFQPKLS